MRSERGERGDRNLRADRGSSWERFTRGNLALIGEREDMRARNQRGDSMFRGLYGSKENTPASQRSRESAVAQSSPSLDRLADKTASALFGDDLFIDELELYG